MKLGGEGQSGTGRGGSRYRALWSALQCEVGVGTTVTVRFTSERAASEAATGTELPSVQIGRAVTQQSLTCEPFPSCWHKIVCRRTNLVQCQRVRQRDPIARE